MRKRRVHPQFISGRYLAPERSGATAVDQPYDSCAVDRSRHRLAKAQIAKPRLFPGDFRKRFGTQIVHVKKQKAIFEACSQIVHVVVSCGLLFFQHAEVFSTEPAENIGVSAFEANHLRILARHKQKDEFVEIWQAHAGAILLPVVWILLENDALAGDVLLQDEKVRGRRTDLARSRDSMPGRT